MLSTQVHDKRQQYFTIAVFILLLSLGTYHSVLFFGHQQVPNPDFMAFQQVGKELWSFQLPTSYKRAPVVGLLQVFLSKLISGDHPDLTAGWLLNAILHPFNLILLWLVGRKVIGRSALWVAIVASINPWLIQLLTEPLAETTLLFFILLTFYFMFNRSRWAYLFASITTMVRYEGAALILACFVMDIIYSRDKRQWLRSFVYSVLASLPLIIWLIGTFFSMGIRGEGTYFIWFEIEKLKIAHEVIAKLWMVTFNNLATFPTTDRSLSELLLFITKIAAGLIFIFGCIYGLVKRRWNILALLIFLVPYMIIHILFTFSLARFYAVVYWIVLFLCWYGTHSLWLLLNKNDRIPKTAVTVLLSTVLIVAISWLALLLPHISQITKASPICGSFPYVTILVAVLIISAYMLIYKTELLYPRLIATVLVCLAAISNQFILVHTIEKGHRNLEFKLLANWYREKAIPGERLYSTMSTVTAIFIPEYKDCFFAPRHIKADTPQNFIRKCYQQNITYVVWDSRLCSGKDNHYYKAWGLKSIAGLAKPRSIGLYEFLDQIRVSQTRYLNIFRLKRPPQPTNRSGNSN